MTAQATLFDFILGEAAANRFYGGPGPEYSSLAQGSTLYYLRTASKNLFLLWQLTIRVLILVIV